MSSQIPGSSAPGETAPLVAGPQQYVLLDTQFQALLAAAKGHSPASVVVADVAAVNADVVARLKQVLVDAEGAYSGVHGAAKAVQADVKANWPLLLVGFIAIAGFALQILGMIGIKL